MSRRGKTSSHRRVVITGMGVLAPNGKTLTEFWDANVRGVSGIGRLSQEEAQAFGELLRERLAKFGLKISDKKSRIIEFGRHAWQRARRKGCRTPTFDFLGFTHYGDKTRKGTFKLGRKTSSRRMRLKLKAMNLWMKSVRNAAALEEWWPVLQAKLRGHYNYFGVSGNARWVRVFWHQTWQMAFKWINRRSQRKSFTMKEYYRFLRWNPLPQPRIYHSFYVLASK